MIPIGYMYKTVSQRPDWLKKENVTDIYSVSNCISEDFTDWVDYWKHNGYWFFDSPKIIEELAKENSLSLKNCRLFYYEAFEEQWNSDDQKWEPYEPEKSFATNVLPPKGAVLQGYDIVSFCVQTSAECSPLSCNHMAREIEVNQHCLIFSFGEAKKYLEEGKFNECEPGPYRIFAVYTMDDA